jgi:hypothetical protein
MRCRGAAIGSNGAFLAARFDSSEPIGLGGSVAILEVIDDGAGGMMALGAEFNWRQRMHEQNGACAGIGLCNK